MNRLSRRNLIFLTVAFAASRVIFYALGVRFDASRLETMWQFLDAGLLRDDLARSLFHLHAQPPLYNLFVGLVLKLFPGRETLAFQIAHMIVGWSVAIALLALLRRLGAGPVLATFTALAIVVSPAFVVYEAWLFYSLGELALLAWAALLLHRFASRRRARDGALFFSALAALVLLRASFHVGWLALVAALLAIAWRRRWRQVVKVAAAPLLVATLWYGKNLALFGSFSSSTWLGMNVSRVAVDTIPKADREALIARGELSPLARIATFRPLDAYALPKRKPTRIPALDAPFKAKKTPNFNNVAYIDLSRRYWADDRRAIVARPGAYLAGVSRAASIYLMSPTDYWMFSGNGGKLGRYKKFFDDVIYGVRQRTSITLCFALPLSILYAIGAVVRRRRDRAFTITALFMAGAIAYVTLVSTLLDVGENNRFRFPIDPLVAVLVVLAARALARRIARLALA